MSSIISKKISWVDMEDDDEDANEDETSSSLIESSKINNDLVIPIPAPSPTISAISTIDSVTGINGMIFKYKRCPLIDTINGCPHQMINNTICPITEGIHPTRICGNGSNCKYVICDQDGYVRKINCTFLHPEIEVVHQQICTFHEQKRCNFNDICCHHVHIPHHISHYNRDLFKKLLKN